MDDRVAHRTLVMLQHYFYNTSRNRFCECGCGRRVSLENYWKHPTIYRKVPEFIRGHSTRHRQTSEYSTRTVQAIKRALRPRRSKPDDREKKKPYSSVRIPSEHSAQYHQHHPGYFARKSKEWMERQPKSLRLAFYAERSKRMRAYGTAYSKLTRRLQAPAKSPPSFTTREKVEIDNSAHLSELLRKVKAQHPEWFSYKCPGRISASR